MFHFPTFGSDWWADFGAIVIALFIGKAIRSESRVLLVCLIGAVLTDSWVGVVVPAVLCLVYYPFEFIKKAVSS